MIDASLCQRRYTLIVLRASGFLPQAPEFSADVQQSREVAVERHNPRDFV
jgi:hypothetical protein